MGRCVGEAHIAMPEEDRMYGMSKYWEDRYKENDEPFEWYQSYDNIKDKIKAAFQNNTSGKILNLGCGNSRLHSDLYVDGFKDVTSVDFSSTVIESEQGKCAEKPELKFEVMDVRDLKLRTTRLILPLTRARWTAF